LITFQNYSADIGLNNRLFVYFLLSSFFREQLDEKRTGTTVAGIKAEKLKQLLLPVPPVSEQLRISSAVESAFSVINEIERNKADLQTAVIAAKSKILFRSAIIPICSLNEQKRIVTAIEGAFAELDRIAETLM
jgi:restriction endonuclease S subunit